MAAPGTIGNLVAPGEDAANRKHEDLSREVKELRPSIMETLLPIIADLQAQQDELAAQNAVLTAAVAEIATLVNTQLSPDVGHGDVAAFSLATGPNVEKVRVTFTVPSGYTRALVYATGTLVARNSTASND